MTAHRCLLAVLMATAACGGEPFTAAPPELAAIHVGDGAASGDSGAEAEARESGPAEASDGDAGAGSSDTGHDAEAGPKDAAPDVGRDASADAPQEATLVCLGDLSGAPRFSVHFTLTTTSAGLTVALLSQRSGCDETSSWWNITLSPSGSIVAETCAGSAATYVFAVGGAAINDGQPHSVDVIWSAGELWSEVDGHPHSAKVPDAAAFSAFAPLAVGSSACAGVTAASGHATVADVCLTSP